jgi:type IV pilus assembly protein PilB
VALSPNAVVSGPPLSGLARRFVANQMLSEEQARESQARAVRNSRPIVSQLVEDRLIPPAKLAEFASDEFGTPLLDLGSIELDVAVFGEFGEKLIRTQHALPLYKRGRKLYLALSDPTNLQALDEFKFASGFITEAVLVEEDKLAKAIDSAISAMQASSIGSGDADLQNIDIESGEIVPPRKKTPGTTRKMRRSSATSTGCCSTPSTAAARTSISSRTRRNTASATVSTANSRKSRRRRCNWRRAWPRA